MKTAQRLLIALALLLAACVDQKVPVNFSAICAPPDDAEKCAFAATCDAILASVRPGVITLLPDGATINRLELPLQIDNGMLDNGNPETGMVNTHDALIESYEFTFDAPFPAGKVTFPGNGRVPAAGSTVMVVPVVPESAMAEIQAGMAGAGVTDQTLVVGVVAKGALLDGSTFQTGEYRITVDVRDATCVIDASTCKAGDLIFQCPNRCQTASLTCVTP